MIRARTIGAACLLAAALVLTGCAGSPPVDTPTGSSDQTSPPPASETPAAEPTSTAPTDGAYVEFTDGAIEATAGPKVLFFHASWCPQCRQLDEQLIAEGAPDGLTIFKVDYDSRSDLRQEYGVTLQTTVVFVDDDGAAISSAVLYDDPSIESLLAAMP